MTKPKKLMKQSSMLRRLPNLRKEGNLPNTSFKKSILVRMRNYDLCLSAVPKEKEPHLKFLK